MRENTGLQVALIIFVMITVVLAVTTYWAFTEAQAKARAAKQANDEAQREKKATDELIVEKDELRKLLGYQRDAQHAKILADFRSDMMGAGFDPDASNYPAALKSLIDKSNKLSAAILTEQEARRLAEQKRDEILAQDAANNQQYVVKLDAAKDDLATRTNTFMAARTKHTKDMDDLEVRLKKVADESNVEKAKSTREIDALSTQIATLAKRNEILTDRVDAVQSKGRTGNERPDGGITWVNQRGGTVYLNLGSDDGLSRGTMFTVYDAGTINIANAEPKASIEVTTVRRPGMAEARIVEDTLSNPILPQDVIYSPVWSPGQKTHFALVGFMDIDKDGKSDRRIIRSLIEQNGGVVDAEVLEGGDRKGKMSINTRYLVQGEKATDKTDAKTIDASTRMIQEAQDLGIEKISVERLLSDMGWRGSDRTVGGRGASGGDFKAVPKKETDLSPKGPFQQRSRPGSNTRRGSAY